MNAKKLLFLVAFIFSFSTIKAQITTSSVSGKLLNIEIPVSDAQITLLHLPTNSSFKTISNKQGSFSLENLTVGGPYRITVVAKGFVTYENSSIELSLGDNDLPTIKLEKEGESLKEVVITIKLEQVIILTNVKLMKYQL